MTGAGGASDAIDQQLARMAELAGRIAGHLPQQTTTPAPPTAAPAPPTAPPSAAPAVHGPRVTVSRDSGMVAGPGSAAPDGGPTPQQAHLADLVDRYTRRTRRSKEAAARHRGVLADSRAVVGFRSSTKEMLYPIAAHRAAGAHLEDIDGNHYVDITMGFGVLLFGHEPEFVTEAVREHLSRGVRLGPRDPATGEAAELLADISGLDRVAFACTGTEANAGALRLARAATGRDTVVVFHSSYHGHADSVLGRSAGSGDERVTVPVSPGIPAGAVSDLLVLDYGDPGALAAIEAAADRIAAVVLEPVQSRNPALQPVEFVRALREMTRRHGIVLMFDEMLTGFRPALRGAQELYGVTPDLATYGKVLGGGFPVGAIAGRADIMDGVDGGAWSYGDASHPSADTTFFGGTYLQHPVSMTAAAAVLRHLSAEGPGLQQRLNARTDEFATTLNTFFEEEEFPLRVRHFGSQFRFEHRADMELLYHHLMVRGVHVWEWRNFFLSTAHTDGDIERITDAVRGSLRELRGAGFFARAGAARAVAPRPAPAATPAAPAASAAVPDRTAADRPGTVTAMAWNTAAARPTAAPPPVAATTPAAEPVAADGPARPPEFSIYFFGDYPEVEDGYELIAETARFADANGFHALWMPERHFHSFGGLFPNPSVLAAALARETSRVRLNAGSVVLPLHDPIRVAEEWSMVDNLSGGRVGIGAASGWHSTDFVFFPERYGRHRELMYEQLADVRTLWRGESLTRDTGDGKAEVRIFPRPVQELPPMYTAVVGNPASYELAGRNDVGIVTNLMAQSVEELTANIARYRAARAGAGLDPAGGHVAVLLHTYLADDHDTARADAYEPLARYMRASLSLFGTVSRSLGHHVDMNSLDEDDLDTLFRRAYGRYCDQRALIGTVESVAPVVEAVTAAGADEIVSLVDFGVPSAALRGGLRHLDALRRGHQEPPRVTAAPPAPAVPAATNAPAAAADTTGQEATGQEATAPDPADAGAPLSPAQQRVWITHRMFPDSTSYNEVKGVRFDGPLDLTALHDALRGLVARHPGLRTVFRETADGPRQYVRAADAPERLVLSHAVVDRRDAGPDPEAAVREVLAAESARTFDLADGPLLFTRLVATGDDRHVLVLSMHHIVADAHSASILARDLSALYRARLTGTAPDLPALDRTPADVARDELAAHQDGKAAADLGYWRRALAGAPTLCSLPTDRPRPATLSSRGRAVFRDLDATLSDELRDLSRRHRATLFMTLIAGYAVALRRLNGQDDIVIGTPTSTRPPGHQDVLGLFLNSVALRLDLSAAGDFPTLLRQVRGVALDAYDHADAAFDQVVAALAVPRTTGHTPVFQVIAEYESHDPFHFDLPDVTATALDTGADKTLTDLTVYFTDRPTGVRCHLEYSTDLFTEETVDRFFTTLRSVLAAAVSDPDGPLPTAAGETAPGTAGTASDGAGRADAAHPAGGPEPESGTGTGSAPGTAATGSAPRDVPAAWHDGPVRAVPAVTVSELVARRTAEGPGRAAVVDGDRVLTYRELSREADRLAAVIRARSAATEPTAPVAVWLPRGADLVVALLAVLWAGRPYLPLDPALGRTRAETVIAEAKAPLLLTAAPGSPGDPDVPASTTLVGIDEPAPADAPASRPGAPGPDDACYVIHTSGSTGTPKGVVVPHRAVVNLCQWHHRRFDFTAADRTALLCSQSFDASVLEIWPTLTAGATLTVADDTTRRDAKALAAWYTAQRVTFAMLPTALAETLLQLPAADQPPLRHCVAGGDVLRTRPHPSAAYEVVNIYGPTETTVLCTHHTVPPAGEGSQDGPIPIGRPIDNARLTVLGADGEPAPVGTPGELYVAGAGVADGYLHRPDATAERFAVHPGRDGGEERRYRTGDLVRWGDHGALEFLGRSDDQVKIRGFRVEPEETAHVLSSLSEVREAVVLPQRDHGAEARLVAHVVPAEDVGGDDEDHRAFADWLTRRLTRRLPEYLIPGAWSVLPQLPLTGTGKVDRAALPAPRHTTRLPAPAPRGDAATAPDAPPVTDAGAAQWEQRLRALWSAELRLPAAEIDADASFFSLGGHSITAIRLANRIRAAHGAELPLAEFYQRPTLRQSAEQLAAEHPPSGGTAAAGGETAVGAEPALGTETAAGRASGGSALTPATVQQRAFLAAQETHPLPQVFNVAIRFVLDGALDVRALRAALTALVARHESLRLRFRRQDGRWFQEVLPPDPVPLPEEDLTALAEPERAAEAERIGGDLAQRPFDLTTGAGPVLRLLRTGEQSWALLLVLHHATCDGWAVSTLLQDLAALYRAELDGTADPLPEVSQSTDYARWQLENPLPPEESERRVAHWVRELGDVPWRLGLPTDRPRPAKLSGAGSAVVFTLPAGVRRGVERLAREQGATAFAVTAAAMGTMLARRSGQADVLLTVAHANRVRQEFEELVACTSAPYVLRVPVAAAEDFGKLVGLVGRGATEAADRLLPMDEIAAAVREATGDRDLPARVPVSFQYQNTLLADLDLPGVEAAVEDLVVPAVRTEISFGLVPAGDVLVGYIAYSTDLWDEETVRGWAEDYTALLTERVRPTTADTAGAGPAAAEGEAAADSEGTADSEG